MAREGGGGGTDMSKITFLDEQHHDEDDGSGGKLSRRRTVLTVVVGRQIAGGGFGSSVFEARDDDGDGSSHSSTSRRRKCQYALKRIDCRRRCGDDDGNSSSVAVVDQCMKEAKIYRSFRHPNLMPLLGINFEEPGPEPGVQVCSMLFPYVPHSLRDDITARRLLDDTTESERNPYDEREVLTLFGDIVRAVRTMHDAGYSHRDVKVENVLLRNGAVDGGDDGDDDVNDEGRGGDRGAKKARTAVTPILTDFGSAGPIVVPLRSRADVTRVLDEAESQTTVEYRAPELFRDVADGEHDANANDDRANNEGDRGAAAPGAAYGPGGGGSPQQWQRPRVRQLRLRHGPTDFFDYGRSDVWSLGCLLFAMMYGSTPFVVRWAPSLVPGMEAEGTVRIVECTTVEDLLDDDDYYGGGGDGNGGHDGLPPLALRFPPEGTAADRRYGDETKDLIRWMLSRAREERPSSSEVEARVERLLLALQLQGTIKSSTSSSAGIHSKEPCGAAAEGSFGGMVQTKQDEKVPAERVNEAESYLLDVAVPQ